MSNLVHQEIKGYELQEVLGEGGFGAVYRAYQALVKREVAIKVILPEYASQPDFVRRFETEAQLVARLEHLHIVPLYDYWRDPSGAFLVMRMLRGGSLEESLKKEGAWSAEAAARLLEQVASALQVAHGSNVIHRDLKPANILLDNERNAYLSDFGIAKDVGDTTGGDIGTMVGTPAYVSPEQIQNQKVTPQTDIYSLGLVMYEVLTGKAAFQGRNPSALILQQMTENVPNLRATKPDLPDNLNMVIQIATAKDPANRFPTVLSFAAAFRQAIEGKRDSKAVRATKVGEGEDDLLIFPANFEPFVLSPELLDLEAPEIQLVNPYKGLRAFQEGDADDFFGREALTQTLLERLLQEVRGQRFLAVVGPSGSGKSSVVKAGVIPAMRKGALPNSENYFIAEMVPSTDALRELEAALLSVAILPPDNIHEQLRSTTEGLHNVIQQILPADGSELFLMIDQFEEVFTQTEDNAVRTHFMDMLQYAITAPDSRFRVVITIRADFFDKPLMYAEFGALVRERFEVVLPLNREELERTIVGPAERAGARVEPELTQRIVDEVVAEPGALPLLQYALTELFERRTGITLTLSSYTESGGVLASLARRAEELYLEMDKPRQEAIRQLFLRLVTLGEGTEDTRRRILWSELVFQQEEGDPLQHVLDNFGRYRLLTFDKDPNTREPTVEVAHEALIRQWKRLREWLRNSREDLRAQRRLSSAVQEWRNSGGEDSFLASGIRLQQFETLLASENLALTKDERDYVQASISKREAEERAEQARLERERRLELRAKRFLRGLVVVLTLAFMGALVLSGYAFLQRADAIDARQEAEVERDNANRQAQANFSLSLAQQSRQFPRLGEDEFAGMSFVANAINVKNVTTPPAEVQRVFAETLLAPGAVRQYIDNSAKGFGGYFWNVDFTTDGGRMVGGSNEGIAYMWDVATGDLLRQFTNHNSWIFSVDISPDDSLLAAGYQNPGTENEIIVLYDLETGEPRPFAKIGGGSHSIAVAAVQFSADGKLLFSGSYDTTPARNLIGWDVATGEAVYHLEGHTAEITDLALSPDGKLLASSGNDGKVILWEVATGEQVRLIEAHTPAATTVAFSPDGQWLATGGSDSKIRLWEIENEGDPFKVIDIPGVEPHTMSYNQEGLLAVGGWVSAKLLIVNTHTGAIQVEFAGTPSITTSATFTPDGRHVVSTDLDVTLWDVYGEGDIVRQFAEGHDDRIYSVALSPDASQAASGSRNGSLQLWDVTTGEALQTLAEPSRGIPNVIHSLAYHPTEPTLLAADQAGHITLWDTATGEAAGTLTGHQAPVRALALNSDGSMVASGGGNIVVSDNHPADNVILLWDWASQSEVRRLEGHTAPVNSVAFSPDGQKLLSGADDNTLILWDVTTGAILHTFTGHSDSVLAVAISPDGLFALSGSRDETIRYWDLTTYAEIAILEGHSSPVRHLAFLPSGSQALSSAGDVNPDSDTTLILWDLTLEDQEIRRLRGHSAGVRDFALSTDGAQLLSGGDDDRLILWRVYSLDELVEWMYATQDVVCPAANANYLAPDTRCVVYTPEPAPETEEPVIVEDSPSTTAAAGSLCSLASPNPLSTDTVDTAAFKQVAPYTIGFSNASNTGQDKLIGAWVRYEASQQGDIAELLVEDAEGSAEDQIADIQNLLLQDVDALIINTVEQNNTEAYTAILTEAQNQGVPVVLVNRHLVGGYTSFVGADEFEVGCAMAQEIVAVLDGEGRWLQLNGIEGTSTDTQRKDGSARIFARYPGMSTTDQRSINVDEAATRAFIQEQIGNSFDAMWAYNGQIAYIAQQVLVENGRAPLPAVGDAYLPLTQFALENNLPLAQVRIPSQMGATAVQVTLQILAGEAVPQFNRVSLELITNANLDDYDLNIPEDGYLGDYEGLPAEFWQ